MSSHARAFDSRVIRMTPVVFITPVVFYFMWFIPETLVIVDERFRATHSSVINNHKTARSLAAISKNSSELNYNHT